MPPMLSGPTQIRRQLKCLPQIFEDCCLRFILFRRHVPKPHAVMPKTELETRIPFLRSHMNMRRTMLIPG